jgi:hypothetical protein
MSSAKTHAVGVLDNSAVAVGAVAKAVCFVFCILYFVFCDL